jgi:hypothetical protein
LKNVKNYGVLNLRPTIVIDNEGLEAIKHIVSIAPQEAQWFHTVEPIEYPQSPGEVFLHLSTKLYIPKQNTSAAQVDSTSSMMIEFYKELVEEYEDQNIVNQKLSSMNCWCHSHVNMNPSPSSQDNSQFNGFLDSSIKQNMHKWQIMLIFNKKDEFYSRVYDPTSGLIFEGIDIQVSTPYDFNYIDEAAKTKFLKPKNKVIKGKWGNTKWITSKSIKKNTSYLEDRFFSSLNDYEDEHSTFLKKTDPILLETAENMVDDIYHSFYPDLSHQHLLPVLPKNKTPEEVYKDIEVMLDDDEILWLSFICSGKEKNIKNIFSENQIKSYFTRYPNKPKENICKYLSTSNDMVSTFKEKIISLVNISNCTNPSELRNIF